jgi:hypothetical protein
MATRTKANANPPEGADGGEGAEMAWGVPIPGTGGALTAPPSVARDENGEIEPGQKIVMLLSGGGLPDETSVRVYKRIPNSQRYAWCKNYSAHEFLSGDLEMIRNEWGPGEYSIRVYGTPRGMEREDITISAPNIPGNAANAVPTQIANQQQSEMARVLEKISEQNAAVLAALSQKPDPMQNMSVMLDMARSMREAFGISGAPAAAAAPAPAPVSALQQITEMAAAMRAFREVAKEMGDGDKPDADNPMSLLGQITDLVKAGIGARTNAPALPAPIQPMQIPQTLQDAAPTSEEPGTMVMKGTLAALLALKNQGGTVEQGGEFIAEKIPDELLPYLDLPNWFDILCRYAPELAPHGEWVKAATAHAITLLRSEPNG